MSNKNMKREETANPPQSEQILIKEEEKK